MRYTVFSTVSNAYRTRLLDALTSRFGAIKKLNGSQSLFSIGEDGGRLYLRYSKWHDKNRAFFGLRDVDLRRLEGRNSYICFLLDDDAPPVFLPFADFEEIFRNSQAALDGQHKVQLLRGRQGLEFYVARQGRFNAEAYVGFNGIENSIRNEMPTPPTLGHSDVQTLLGSIGNLKGYDVWIPASDCGKLVWSLTREFRPVGCVPSGYEAVGHILSEVDVVWIKRGGNAIEGLFEVEHSTSIYSGLLRFNDLLLTNPRLSHFSIVSDDSRRSVFSKQLYRPTFQKSGLSERTSFLDYRNVHQWHARLMKMDAGLQ